MQSRDLTRAFAFLRRLRAGGRSNMYGAVPYLARALEIDREQAFRVVCDWVDQEEAERGAAPDEAPAPRPSPGTRAPRARAPTRAVPTT